MNLKSLWRSGQFNANMTVSKKKKRKLRRGEWYVRSAARMLMNAVKKNAVSESVNESVNESMTTVRRRRGSRRAVMMRRGVTS